MESPDSDMEGILYAIQYLVYQASKNQVDVMSEIPSIRGLIGRKLTVFNTPKEHIKIKLQENSRGGVKSFKFQVPEGSVVTSTFFRFEKGTLEKVKLEVGMWTLFSETFGEHDSQCDICVPLPYVWDMYPYHLTFLWKDNQEPKIGDILFWGYKFNQEPGETQYLPYYEGGDDSSENRRALLKILRIPKLSPQSKDPSNVLICDPLHCPARFFF